METDDEQRTTDRLFSKLDTDQRGCSQIKKIIHHESIHKGPKAIRPGSERALKPGTIHPLKAFKLPSVPASQPPKRKLYISELCGKEALNICNLLHNFIVICIFYMKE